MRGIVSLLLQAAVIGLAAAFIAVLVRPELLPRPPATGVDFSTGVAAAAPAVVSIYTTAEDTQSGAGLGSGVILSADGVVATNWHVVHGAQQIRVQLADGRSTRPRLLGMDPETELALLAIDLPDLPTIPLGDSERLRPGQVVLAIGNAFGLSQTVTQGIVSAVGRGELGVTTFENFIQTDAAINVGNSGGALINTRGELVGINTAVVSALAAGEAAEGIGFAIPVNLVRGVAEQLLEHGRVIRGWLGVEPVALSAERRRLLGLPESLRGIELIGVAPDSPAARAGLRRGDVLTHVDDHELLRPRQALNLVASLPPGEQIVVRGLRQGEAFELRATLAERPAQ